MKARMHESTHEKAGELDSKQDCRLTGDGESLNC
jgi:hypothetical protein